MTTTISSGSYQVFLGNDGFHQLGKFLSEDARQNTKKFILVDGNTKIKCLPLLHSSIPEIHDAIILEMDPGEQSKSIETVIRLWNELTDHGTDRNSILINLGGGTVSDLGGFVAATYMRGIDFINIPTTLLAMVDASVGGKNGINFAGFKNQIGTFDEPKAIFVWPEFLKTLPEEEIRSGFAEVIKHALVSDRNKWNEVRLIENLQAIQWFDIIRESISIKSQIVNSDYRDKGLRKILNFGHTLGHALESYSQQHHSKPLKHGEAIAMGMIGEVFLSKQVCGLNATDADEIWPFIRKHYSFESEFDHSEVISLMKGDKKNADAKINFSLIKQIGEPVVDQSCDETDIRKALQFCLEAQKSF